MIFAAFEYLFLHVVYAGWLPIKEILKLSRNFFMNIINK